MARLRVRTWGDPVLKTRARQIPEVTEEIRRLAADMLETMHVEGGVGLAANQVGITKRIFAAEVESPVGPPRRVVLLNPRLVSKSRETSTEEEGCLSFPGIYGTVERSEHVVAEGEDLEGRTVRIEASGLLARAFQHELDHLDGVVFIERMPMVQRIMLNRQLRELARQTQAARVGRTARRA